MQDKTTEIFRDAPVPKAVISNVIPSIVSMIMVLIYNLADTFFIGQTKNAYMVAAVSVATPAFLIFMAVGMLFGIGGTSLIVYPAAGFIDYFRGKHLAVINKSATAKEVRAELTIAAPIGAVFSQIHV